jgi:hypothetical protein
MAAGMAERTRRRVLPREAAFWVLAGMFLILFFASAAASPLYGVYQARFHFSAATLTAVFAVYVLVLLVTLLIFGSLSDHLGRIPVIITALVFSVAACVVFLIARDTAALYGARALQGVATGLASGPIGFLHPGAGSGLADHQRSGAVRPGTDPSDLVGAAGRVRRQHRRDGLHSRTRVQASRGAGLAAAPGCHPAPGPGRVLRSPSGSAGDLGARRPVPLARAVAGRPGDGLV